MPKTSTKSDTTKPKPHRLVVIEYLFKPNTSLEDFLKIIAGFTAAGLGVLLTVDGNIANRRYSIVADFLTVPCQLSKSERRKLFGRLIEVSDTFAATHPSKATKGAPRDQ